MFVRHGSFFELGAVPVACHLAGAHKERGEADLDFLLTFPNTWLLPSCIHRL
jgi:hypothetical protein